MKHILLTLLCISTFSLSGKAEGNAQKYINKELKTDSLFTNAIVGILAVNDEGDVVAEWNSNLPMLTASTMKTITTGAGLVYLGPDFRFSTRIAYTGEIKDSILKGNLYIIGGGDPTLGSKDPVAFKIDSIFGVWAGALKQTGIKKIDGNIVADDSYFTREQMPDSWSWGNFGASYGSAPSGLSFYENVQDFKLIPGKQPGDSVTIVPVYPQVPGLQVINELTTGKAKSGDRSGYYVQDITKASRYEGSVPADRPFVLSDNSNRFPHLSCGYHFREYLLTQGIDSKPEILDIKNSQPAPDEARIFIAETFSPELWKIVNVTNHISNNLYAETILKTIGKQMTGTGSYDSSRVAIKRVLKNMGVDTYGLTMADGSGLSRENYVSPKFFCNYYSILQESNIFVPFFNSLPVPGKEGTLKSVLKNENPEIKNKIHAKSGSLSSVRCYAGFVQGGKKSGLIKFVILTNNYAAYTSKMQPKIEGFLKALTTEK